MVNMDNIGVVFFIAGATYYFGYRSLGIGIFVIMMLGVLLARPKRAPVVVNEASVQGLKIKGAQVLEPIVIESTRGPPFRIPSEMRIRVKPNWSAYSWFEKAAKGVGQISRFMFLQSLWAGRGRRS